MGNVWEYWVLPYNLIVHNRNVIMIFLKAQIIIYCLLILILNISLKNLTTESPKISRNYSISRYSDHSRLLDMPFTLPVTDDTTNCAIMTRDMTRETLAMTHDDSDSKLMTCSSNRDSRLMTRDSTRDSDLGKSDDLRLDSRLGTCDSGLDSRLDSHDSCTALGLCSKRLRQNKLND